jgi:predicted nucleotidyltransferase
MASVDPNHPILRAARAAAEARFGPRLERVILFGSRARGDHTELSDWDIALVLNDEPTKADWTAAYRLDGELFDLTGGAAVQFLPVSRAALERRGRYIYLDIEREGVPL